MAGAWATGRRAGFWAIWAALLLLFEQVLYIPYRMMAAFWEEEHRASEYFSGGCGFGSVDTTPYWLSVGLMTAVSVGATFAVMRRNGRRSPRLDAVLTTIQQVAAGGALTFGLCVAASVRGLHAAAFDWTYSAELGIIEGPGAFHLRWEEVSNFGGYAAFYSAVVAAIGALRLSRFSPAQLRGVALTIVLAGSAFQYWMVAERRGDSLPSSGSMLYEPAGFAMISATLAAGTAAWLEARSQTERSGLVVAGLLAAVGWCGHSRWLLPHLDLPRQVQHISDVAGLPRYEWTQRTALDSALGMPALAGRCSLRFTTRLVLFPHEAEQCLAFPDRWSTDEVRRFIKTQWVALGSARVLQIAYAEPVRVYLLEDTIYLGTGWEARARRMNKQCLVRTLAEAPNVSFRKWLEDGACAAE